MSPGVLDSILDRHLLPFEAPMLAALQIAGMSRLDRYHSNICSGYDTMFEKKCINKYTCTYLLCIYLNTLLWPMRIDSNNSVKPHVIHLLVIEWNLSINTKRWFEILQSHIDQHKLPPLGDFHKTLNEEIVLWWKCLCSVWWIICWHVSY